MLKRDDCSKHVFQTPKTLILQCVGKLKSRFDTNFFVEILLCEHIEANCDEMSVLHQVKDHPKHCILLCYRLIKPQISADKNVRNSPVELFSRFFAFSYHKSI